MKAPAYFEITPGPSRSTVVVTLRLNSLRKVASFARDTTRSASLKWWARPIVYVWLLAYGLRRLVKPD